MITPIFTIQQNFSSVDLHIKCPNANLNEVELSAEDDQVVFYAKPYFLRLHLPSLVVNLSEEEAAESVNFDVDSQDFRVTIEKKNPGEHFENLQLLTKLLTPNSATPTSKIIEVLNSTSDVIPSDQLLDEDGEEIELDWTVEPDLFTQDFDKLSLNDSDHKYGFAAKCSGFFADYTTFSEVFGLSKCPDQCSFIDRLKEFENIVVKKFDSDHYLADFFESEAVDSAIAFEPFWISLFRQLKAGESEEDMIAFSEDEKFSMKNLPRREYLFDNSELKTVIFGLADLLFAFAFDIRCSEGEHSVESQWTVSHLCPSMHWFLKPHSVKEVIVNNYKSALCFPFHRNWKLCQKVLKDVLMLLRLGSSVVLYCLLDLRKLMQNAGGGYHILADLFLTDYCVWLQTCRSDKLRKLFNQLYESIRSVQISKCDLNLDLESWEEAGRAALDDNS